MKLVLAGTASAQGWPVPDCPCASCRAAECSPRRPLQLEIGGVALLPLAPDLITPPGWQIEIAGQDGSANEPHAMTIRTPDGATLLLTPAAIDPPPMTERPFDAVLVFQGDASLDALGTAVARLRRSPLLDAHSAIFAVGVGHQNPPEAEIRALLTAWRVWLPSDGDELSISAQQLNAAAPGRRTLVLGGTRSGKSQWAERQLLAEPQVTYVATAEQRADVDWAARISTHRRRRPADWSTVETTDLVKLLDHADAGIALLIDDLGNWVTRMIDNSDGWSAGLQTYRAAAQDLVHAWRQFRGRAVLISPEVGAGVHPPTRAGRTFADEVGLLAAQLSAESDEVVSVLAGLPRWLRAAPGTIVA